LCHGKVPGLYSKHTANGVGVDILALTCGVGGACVLFGFS